jgi:hydrogenase/urease accessory protein HupE
MELSNGPRRRPALAKLSPMWTGIVLFGSAFASSCASAHSEQGAAIDFWGGFTHPIFGLDHVIAMVAVGLWGAFLGPPAIWVLPVVFPLVMAVAGALGVLGLPLHGVETGIALSAIMLGAMVAGAVKPPLWIAAVLVGAFAVFHGYAHGIELPVGADAIAFFFHGLRHRDWHAPSRGDRIRQLVPLAGRPDRCAPRRCGRRGHRLWVPDRCRMKSGLLAFVLLTVAGSTPAFAHSPIMGIGGVVGGVLHALLIPEHGLSLLALGLVLGLTERPARRTGYAVFAVALLCGLVAAAFSVGEALAADILLAATGIIGLLAVTLWTPTTLVWGAAAVVGLTIALDSRPEVASNAEAIRMLFGSGIGAMLALVIVAEVSFLLRSNAQRIVARVMGSWITAIAILVLSLRIVTQMTVG